jgi:hypothetical protein
MTIVCDTTNTIECVLGMLIQHGLTIGDDMAQTGPAVDAPNIYLTINRQLSDETTSEIRAEVGHIPGASIQ